MSDRRRKAVIESVAVHREFIAAGFRCPLLVDQVLARLPREHRDMIKIFTAELERVLAACDVAAERAQSGSPVNSAAQSKSVRPGFSSPTMVKPRVPLAAQFRACILGSKAAVPDPLAIETFVTPANSLRSGLVHGDTVPLNNLLAANPLLEKFLAKHLVGVDDSFSPFGGGGEEHSDAQSALDASVPTQRPKVSDEHLDTLHDDSVSGFEPLPLVEAFAQASMLWTQSHPVDLAALARDRCAAIGSPSKRQAPKFEDVQNMLLRCNLELRFPKEEWEMLLLGRDAAREELLALGDELLASPSGADVTSSNQASAARGRLAIALNNCRDGLMNVGPSSTPAQVKEFVSLKLTHLLADVTSIAHDQGIVLGASGASSATAAPVAKQSIFQRFQNRAKTSDAVKLEEELDELGRQIYSISMAAKRHIKFVMQNAAAPTKAPTQAAAHVAEALTQPHTAQGDTVDPADL